MENSEIKRLALFFYQNRHKESARFTFNEIWGDTEVEHSLSNHLFGEFVESFDCDWAKFILSLDGTNTKKLTEYIFKV